MGGWAGAGLGLLKGFDRAAGANAAANDIQGVQDARIQNKQAAMQQQIAPLSQALQATRTRLALYANPDDPTKPLEGKEAEYAASHDQAADLIGKMRSILHPPPPEDPHGIGYLGARVADKLHITRDLAGHMRENQSNKVNDYYQKNNQAANADATTMAQATPYNPLSPDEQKDAVKIKAGLTPKDTTEQERFVINYQKEHPDSTQEQALRAFTDATNKTAPKAAAPLEAGGVMYGVRGSDGKEYYPGDMVKPDTPAEVKQIYQTVKDAQKAKMDETQKKEQEVQDRFDKNQARLEKQFERVQQNLGSWSVDEDKSGNSILLNSKTGESKAAPEGLHKSGYFAKNVAPLEAADSNIKDYMASGKFNGPQDLALQHEFFTATQPATGFRMTKVQQDILADSQSWVDSVKGKLYHTATGTWFSPTQRKQIADAAQQAIAAKKKSLGQTEGGPKTQELRDKQGGNDPVDKFLKSFPSQ